MALAGCCAVSLVSGCSRCSKSVPGHTATSSSAAAASAAASAAARTTGKRREGWPIPGGPRLAILAGKGLGSIRIGATVATVERHMQAKCDDLTDKVCRYVARAVEFELEDGVVVSVRVHRPYRPAGGTDKDGYRREYGVFNGAIPPDVQFGMHIQGVQMTIGKPQRVEQVNDPVFGTKELHYYPGMILEFDQLPNAPLTLGGVRVVPE